MGNITESIKGQGLSKTDKGLGYENIILYGELYTTYGNYIRKVLSNTSEEKVRHATPIEFGDLLLPLSSTTKEAQIGKVSVYVLNEKTYLGSDALILRHTQNAGYLMYLLNSTWFKNLKMKCVKGTTISHLDYKQMLNILIPLPSITKQKRIVKILDQFDTLINDLAKGLPAEIAARTRQYEYYRDKLLMFKRKS